MPAPRSLLWRLVPWLFPLALIFVGLIFVATSLSDNDQPDDIVAPPNVRDVTTANAAPWALRQVLPGVTSTVTDVMLVESAATGDATYSVRAVIARVDSPVDAAAETSDSAADARLRTIVTCVRWTVDVSNGTIAEHGASQLSNETGRRALGDSDTLRAACRSATFAS